jgi:hypothetical protein
MLARDANADTRGRGFLIGTWWPAGNESPR